MKCTTEGCDNEATHVDQLYDPICTECVDTAVGIGENPDFFMVISETEIIEPVSDPALSLTIFEETLTESGLAQITTDSAALPEIAKNETDYNLVYEFSTRLKRLSVAVRKKEKALQKKLKSVFHTDRDKIKKDKDFVMSVIDPIQGRLLLSREYIEDWKEAVRENKARDAQAVQQAEFKRLNKERAQQAKEKKAELAAESKRLQDEKDKLARERYEFECEKSRLSVDECWIDMDIQFKDGEPEMKTEPELPTMQVIGNSQDILDAVETLKEFAKNEPAELVETKTCADKTDGIVTVNANLFTDPEQIEISALLDDAQKIKNINAYIEMSITVLVDHQREGFESQTASDAMYQLIESVTHAADKFKLKTGGAHK